MLCGRGLVGHAVGYLAAEFERGHGARGCDELATPQPREHHRRRIEPEQFHAADLDAIRRPLIPPVRIRRGSPGCQHMTSRIGGIQFPHR